MSQQIPILTISQITQAIKLQLEASFPLVRIQGEISNLRRQASGHLYFTLKDAQAQISAVLFRGDSQGLQRLPRDGDQVMVEGAINVYPPRGSYQIVVRHLAPVGLGELLLRYEELKRRLQSRGWFDPEHKKALPQLPRCIGVVTSPTGAAIQDMLHVLGRRFSGFRLLLNPVLVQGSGAAQQVAQAISEFNRHRLVDVIIVARGGGSIEDLWAFNEEIVAAAIHESQIPIISAVGHETDHCLCDFVADLRAPTPSAAAELVIQERAQKLEGLHLFQQRLQHSMKQRLERYRERLKNAAKHPFLSSPYTLLGAHFQRVDEWRGRLDQIMVSLLRAQATGLESKKQQLSGLRPNQRILQLKERLGSLSRQLDTSFTHLLHKRHQILSIEARCQRLDHLIKNLICIRKERLKRNFQYLSALNPKNLLKKGYSIAFSEKSGSVINSVASVRAGDSIRLLVADGEAILTAQETRINGPVKERNSSTKP